MAFSKANDEARLDRQYIVAWNACPWLVRTDKGERLDAEVRKGLEYPPSFLELLPSRCVAVLMGSHAKKAAPKIAEHRPKVRIIETWHPAPGALNRGQNRRKEFNAAVLEAAKIVRERIGK